MRPAKQPATAVPVSEPPTDPQDRVKIALATDWRMPAEEGSQHADLDRGRTEKSALK
jgi:hypothetical protein